MTRKLSFVFLILIALLSFGVVLAQTANNLPATTATYLGGSNADDLQALDIAPDGTMILGGTLPGFNPGGTAPVELLGGGDGVIVRMGSDGTSVLSTTRIGSSVNDLEVGTNGSIAVCGAFGVALLNSSASSVTWSITDLGAVKRCAIGGDGSVAALTSSSKVYLYNSAGTEQANWGSGGGSRQLNDVAIDSASGTVIEAGQDQKTSSLQVAFMNGRDTTGTKKWTNYDFGSSAVFGANLGADSRGLRVAIGRDGKLYFAGYTDGGNAIFGRNPGNINVKLNSDELIATDGYNTTYNLSGSKSLGWYGRFDPSNGAIDRGQFLLTRLSDGKGNSIGIKSITADSSGVIYLAGDAYASIQNRSARQVAGTTVGNYSGGEPYALIVSPDLKNRIIWSPFAAPGQSAGGSPAYAINVRDGNAAVAVTLKLDKGQRTITHNALQSSVGGGSSDGYLVRWPVDYTLPDVPVQGSPAADSVIDEHAPDLIWTGDHTVEFKVIVRTSEKVKLFKEKVLAADVCVGAACNLSLSSRGVSLDNGDYQWKIKAKNDLGKSKTSWSNFTVNFPGSPTIVEPDDNGTVSRQPTFSWSPVAGADEYRLKIKRKDPRQKTKSPWLAAADVCPDICTYTLTEAERLGKGLHVWKVFARAGGIANKSKSDKRSFTVDKSLPVPPADAIEGWR